MKTVIIIQARMGSARLPGKSLMEIEGKPLIWHVVERAKHSKEANKVVLATTMEKIDDGLAEFAKKNGVKCFRGSLEDVLDRYYHAAKEANADVVIRVTGDCPLVDPFLVDEAVRIFKRGKYDYVGNGQEPWMDGFDVEVFSFKALEDAWKNAIMASEREHVTPYIKNNSKNRKFYMKNDPRFDGIQCSVDRREDLEFVRAIYRKMLVIGKDHTFTYKDVMVLLEKRPELLRINKGSVVNEGYFKSIKEDKKVR
ncbi:MAG TPA: glycosyltransferase family protein [Candidatus Bilamarchaeaceae archaeon]|nr:glycosyltransferase family protein [Candidatus Bilamarchaeaceae archaeon]